MENKEWTKYNNSEGAKKYRKEWKLLKRYGITIDGYRLLNEKQKGLCAICGNPNKNKRILSVDHSHKTGLIRGLLCQPCNMAIGLLKEDTSIIEKVLNYLKSNI